MIILDIETSGLNPESCGIWQIGAIDSENTKNIFLSEGRINDGDLIEEEALLVTGKSKEYLLNLTQSEKDLLIDFFKWCGKISVKNCICQNPQFDLSFISIRARKYGLKVPFYHRAFDLHSIAQMKYFQLNNFFLTEKDKSSMNLGNILEFCGIKDERRKVSGVKLIHEGKEHNALEDCKLTGECFSRIIHGKNMFEEFKKFSIPDCLK